VVSRNSLDIIDRILAIKNPDAVWKISQMVSARFGVTNTRGACASRSKDRDQGSEIRSQTTEKLR